MHEEIGTKKARIIAVTREWLRYDLPKPLQAKVWGGKYRGQEQKWFVARFTGVDSDINIATEHPEFLDFGQEILELRYGDGVNCIFITGLGFFAELVLLVWDLTTGNSKGHELETQRATSSLRGL